MSKIKRQTVLTGKAYKSTNPLKLFKIDKAIIIWVLLKQFNFSSQAIVANRTVYLSGCVGIDKDTLKLVEGGIVPETIKALQNAKAVLEAAGSSIENVVKSNIYLADMGDFAEFNNEYQKGNSIDHLLELCSFKSESNDKLMLPHLCTNLF